MCFFFVLLDLGITEHIEGDETKFAVWTGRSPMLSDCRIVLKANSLETKQVSYLMLNLFHVDLILLYCPSF